MDIKELLADAKNLTSEELLRKINSLTRDDYRYGNLNEKNKKIILDLIKKHIGNIRNGMGISATVLENESYRLYQNRSKLGLSEEDLKDIKEILRIFKK